MTAVRPRARYLALGLVLSSCAGPKTRQATTPDAAGTVAAAIPKDWQYPLGSAHPVRDARGMIVTDAPIASRIGAEVLRDGGNAVDAAIATAFALAVVYPEAGNLGGGGFLVLHWPDGTNAALDFREKAPSAASRDMYLGPDGQPTDASITGYRASGVPGTVAGLWAAHQRFGSLPWKRLVEPAIGLADEGFTVDDDLAGSLRDAADRLKSFPASAALFLPGGEPRATGSTWRNPELAETLRRIAENGAAGFYEGRTADLIVAEMRRGRGLITHQDLRGYEAKWREPVLAGYRGTRVISMPPPSSGGIALVEMLHMLEGSDVAALGWHSPEHLHLLAEVMRRAFADRNHYLGDPDFVAMPRGELVSPAYARRRAADIDPRHATRSADIAPGVPSAEPTHTTHFSVVGPDGDAVALTTTLNELYGSAVTVQGAGFVLNDEMDDFAAKPGAPNMFGLVQGEANAIAPGKRMLSSMTPTIVVDSDGRTLLVTGARGGPRIINAVLQIVSNVVDFHMDVGSTVYAPRLHHQHLPDTLWYEAGDSTAPGWTRSARWATTSLPGTATSATHRRSCARTASGPGSPTLARTVERWGSARWRRRPEAELGPGGSCPLRGCDTTDRGSRSRKNFPADEKSSEKNQGPEWPPATPALHPDPAGHRRPGGASPVVGAPACPVPARGAFGPPARDVSVN